VVSKDYAKPQGRITLYLADPNSTEWWVDAYNYVLENNLFAGILSTVWAPDTETTRAIAFEALYRLEGRPAVIGENFADVAESDFFYKAALWAKNTGVSNGSNGLFDGNRSITRTELAAIIVRYLEVFGYELDPADLGQYTDSGSIPAWAAKEQVIEKVVGTGIIQGTSATTLTPNGTARLCEFAQMLLNMSVYVEALADSVDKAA
jgi:hypothetical protein